MADYHWIRRIGAGFFGEVWLVEEKALGGQRALKIVKDDKIKDPTNFYEEPRTLEQLNHRHIVKVMDAGRTTSGSLYIAMEYLHQGSVEDIAKGQAMGLRLPLRVAIDVAQALEYAHNLKYLHRDIKAGNILSDTDKFKLSDFGLATKRSADGTASPDGYLTHLAPEVIQGGDCSVESDIYALAMTIYQLINGEGLLPPFANNDHLCQMIVDGKYPNRSVYQPYVPRKVRLAINKGLKVLPSDRHSSAREFRHALEKCAIVVDWTVSYKADTTIFTGVSQSGKNYIVTYKSGRGVYVIDVHTMTPKGIRRHSKKHSAHLSQKAKAEVQLHSLLSCISESGQLP